MHRYINLFKALFNARKDISYLPIQIRNYLKGGISLDRGYYEFFNNYFFKLNSLHQKDEHFIVDIGANDGWFAKVVMRFAPNSKIISFEPLVSQKEALEKIKNKNDNFNYFGSAIGENRNNVEIIEYSTHGLSSILELAEDKYCYNIRNFQTKKMNQYEVECSMLDDFGALFDTNSRKNNLLKIDTQGYELNVLKGATSLLEKKFFDFIMLELMTVEKYKLGVLYDGLVDFLNSKGYKLCDIYPSCREKNGYLTEFDAVFTCRKFW